MRRGVVVFFERNNMQIIDDMPISPFAIFIKGVQLKTNEEVIKLLGIQYFIEISFEEIKERPEEDENCIYISRDDNWVHIMDGLEYTLCVTNGIESRIKELGKKYDILNYSLGDCDRSYSLEYYKEGKLKRSYIVESPNYNDMIITRNLGEPLLGESIPEKDYCELIPMAVAKNLGIKVANKLQDIKCYDISAQVPPTISNTNTSIKPIIQKETWLSKIRSFFKQKN